MKNKMWMAGALIVALAVTAVAADKKAGEVKASHGITENLKTLSGNGVSVTLVLKGGKEYSGKVKELDSRFVLLTGLQGKEYFDALVRLDDVSALEYRAREK